MDESTACLKPYCDAPAVGSYGIDLCGRHAIKLYVAVERMAQDPLHTDEADLHRRVVARRHAEDLRRQRELIERLPVMPDRREKDLGEWIYFVRFSDRVKIGWSTKLADRLAAIPHDEVLAVIPGGYAEEQALHRRFAHLRVTGEWFKAEDDLMTYVAGQAAEHGRSVTPRSGIDTPTPVRSSRVRNRKIA